MRQFAYCKFRLPSFKICLASFLFLCVFKTLHAQVSVSSSNNANILAQKLVGQGVVISNATMQCNSNQSGTFTASSPMLTMDSGIVLTTGLAATSGAVFGVNSNQVDLASVNQGSAGDADLTVLANIVTYDKCVLEFDFKADGDSIFFKYVFGSEEYPQFNCTNYNDAFGFFISGPGYPTPLNIALIPSTNIPVAINSVNNSVLYSGGNISNCNSMGLGSPFTALYNDNTGGSDLSYQGFTDLFKARAAVQPCSTYHLKLAIADGFDQILDSGVFLESGSLVSNTVKLSVNTDSLSASTPYVFEGCDSAIIKIHRKIVQTQVGVDTVHIQISGTATNGADYPSISSTYTFTASINDTLKTIYLDPINDLITEGTETVVIVLFDKCNNPVDTITIEIKDPPKFILSNQDTTICQGASVQAYGSTNNGLSFLWSPSAGVSNTSTFSAVLSPNVTTTYTLSASYGSCDVIKDSVKITVEPTPTLSQTHTNVLCNGQSNAAITATASVGSTPMLFTLLPGGQNASASPAVFSSLSAGTYTISVASALGCTRTTAVTITQPSIYQWASFNTVNIACNAGNVGQINASTSGGTPVSSYTLMPGNVVNTNGNFSNLAPGTYTVQVKDANNCTLSSVTTISQVTNLGWANVSVQSILCNGQNNGLVAATVAGATGNVTYTLMPGNLSNASGSFNNLGVNTFTINAVDANACTGSTVFTITQPPALNIGTLSLTHVLCNGASSGALSSSASGGTSPLNFVLQPLGLNSNNGQITGIPAGSYTLVVTDANGCTKTTALTITQAPALILNTPSSTNPSCNPGNNGTLSFSASGGTGTLSYSFNNGAFNSTTAYNNLTPGTYTIAVHDANNCTVQTTVNLAITNAPILTNNTAPIPCATNLGQINVSASNGTAPYTYTLMPNNLSNSNGSFPNVNPGTYTVNVVDANLCTSSIVITLTLPPQMQWQSFVVTNLPCNGVGTGSISAQAAGGIGVITYLLNPGNVNNTSGNFNALTINVYTVLATDANGCTINSVAAIVQSPSLFFNAPIVNSPSCNGLQNGSVALSTTGGVGSVTFTKNPGGQTNSSGNFSSLSGITYTFTATDATGCSTTTVLTLTQPPSLTVSNILTVTPSCVPGGDGAVTVTANGGTPAYQFNINNGSYQSSALFNNLNIGLYTLTVKDANNCTATSTVNLFNPNAPILDSLHLISPLCFGNSNGSIQVYVSGSVGTINYNLAPLNLNNTNGQFSNLAANVYTVTISSSNNCTISTVVNLTQPQNLTASISSQSDITCNGLSNGSLQISAQGGTAPITYLLQPVNQSNQSGSFGSLAAGAYTVLLSDAHSCTTSVSTSIIQASSLLFDSFVYHHVLCFSASTGTLQCAVNGGTGSITYSLSPGALTNNNGQFLSLPANAYTFTAIDANGCTLSSVFTLTQAPAILISNLSNTIPSCNPGNNATITVSAGGGTGILNYALNGGTYQASGLFNGIGVSLYTVYVKDANNCVVTATINVVNPASPNFTNVNVTAVQCYGANSGAINAIASGGTGLLTYTLSAPTTSNTTGNFSSLIAGIYTLIVSDANSCSASSVINITEPFQLVWDSVNNRDISCYSGSNGLVTSHASGGSGLITYTLMPLNVSNTNGAFFGLAMGTYTLLATDQNGCVIASVFNINQAPQIIWTAVSTNSVTCFGLANGSANVSASGGNPPFSYKLMPGNVNNTTGSFGNLLAGIYTITAKDDFGCTLTTAVNINQAPQIQITNINKTNASCSPGCDGSATILVSGGTGAYAYSNNGSAFQVSNLYTSLCVGVYTVVVQDANNCTSSSIYSISTVNGPTQIICSVSPVQCFGQNSGALSNNVIGGTPPMQFNLTPNNINNNSGVFNGLGTGGYTVIATDANGCTLSTSASITQPNALAINAFNVQQVSCFGASNGSVVMQANGGTGQLQYSLQPLSVTNTSGVFNNLQASVYTIVVSDVNNCSLSTTTTIIEPPALIINSVTHTDVTCNGMANAQVIALASGGTGALNYALLPTAAINNSGAFFNLSGANYTVVVSDANNCSASSTVFVFEPPALAITSWNAQHVDCFGNNTASLTLSASGGVPLLNYTLLPNNQSNTTGTFNNLTAGNYTLTVSDANACTLSSVQTLTQPALLQLNTPSLSHVLCFGGSNGLVTANANGGTPIYTYLLQPNNLSNASGSFGGLSAGQYTIVVSDVNACSTTVQFTITQPQAISLQVSSTSSPSCFTSLNGTISVQASNGSPGYNYTLLPPLYSNTTGNFVGLASGSFTVNVSDSHGCTASTAPILLTSPPPIQIDTLAKQDVQCYLDSNGMIYVQASGGVGNFTYLIQPNAGIQSPAGMFNQLQSGSYTLTATDAIGCSVYTIVGISNNLQLTTVDFDLQEPSCFNGNNGSLNVLATGGVPPISYSLNNSPFTQSGLFSNLTAGLYDLVIMDSKGCTNDTTVQILEPAAIHANLDVEDTKCVETANGSLSAQALGGTPQYVYYIKPGNLISADGQFQGLAMGHYTLTIKDSNGCEYDTVYYVGPPVDTMHLNFMKKDIACFGYGFEGSATVLPVGGTPPYTFEWLTNPKQTSQTIDSLAHGLYWVVVSDANLCTQVDSVEIAPGPCCEEVFIPSAFSPNNDKRNDEWKVVSSAGIQGVAIEVYDRWGEKVFSTSDIYVAWDGNFKGKPMDVGVYFYVMRYKCLVNNKSYLIKGDLTLVR